MNIDEVRPESHNNMHVLSKIFLKIFIIFLNRETRVRHCGLVQNHVGGRKGTKEASIIL